MNAQAARQDQVMSHDGFILRNGCKQLSAVTSDNLYPPIPSIVVNWQMITLRNSCNIKTPLRGLNMGPLAFFLAQNTCLIGARRFGT